MCLAVCAFFVGRTAQAAAGPAERSHMVGDGIAVFYPAGFDATQHLPSPILLRDLVPTADVPQAWALRPRFSTAQRTEGDGQKTALSVAEINVGDADLYGTGEVFGPLRRNGDRNDFWNMDNGAYSYNEGKRLYQTHPWVLGLRRDGTAFGILADNTWRMQLYCDATVRFESEGPAFRMIVIERETPADVLRALAQLTGTMELPPLWSLGYQQCRFSYYPESQVREVADQFRQRHIPCDVIWMDIHYMDGYRIFTFNPEGFPDPKATNDYLHDLNFKSVYMIDPGVKADPDYFVDQQGTSGDYYVRTADDSVFVGNVWPGPCHFPDFTRADVRNWWSTLYRDFMAQGVDGVWNDMNEPAVFGGKDFTMPVTNIHRGSDGRTAGPHLRYHNTYGYHMVKASREGILAANPTKRPFILSRSNLLGGQRFAATWTGDNRSDTVQMRAAVPMTLNMGLSGQAFNGPDIGGFLENCTPDLLAHWTASGIYFPFARNHSCEGTVQQEPWAFGPEVEDVCRTAINRRYRLLPYIYTLFHGASTEGLPVMRPVFMADTRDLSLRAEQQAYLLGGDLLVVPRWAETPALPKGQWATIPFEEVPLKANRTLTRKGYTRVRQGADDGYQARVALRPGAIVPVAMLFENTVDYTTDELTLLVNLAPDGTADGSLYDDAGDGFEYRHGDYALYRLHAAEGSLTIEQTEGHRTTPRRWRVGIVADGTITYGPWQSAEGKTVTLPLPL